MIACTIGLLAISSLVAAHGDHSQTPLAGPHQGLWYNTLPGDGGTQVGNRSLILRVKWLIISSISPGRLRLLRYLNFWSPALLPVPLE